MNTNVQNTNRWQLQENNLQSLGAQTQNVNCIETSFIGQADFSVARYSATNNDVPSNNLFHFHDNGLEANRTCNVFVQIFYFFHNAPFLY
jgi:hypothetical protein